MEKLMKDVITMVTCIFNMQTDTKFTLWSGMREIEISVTHIFGFRLLAIANIKDVISENTRHVDAVIGYWDDKYWYQKEELYNFVRKTVKAVEEM